MIAISDLSSFRRRSIKKILFFPNHHQTTLLPPSLPVAEERGVAQEPRTREERSCWFFFSRSLYVRSLQWTEIGGGGDEEVIVDTISLLYIQSSWRKDLYLFSDDASRLFPMPDSPKPTKSIHRCTTIKAVVPSSSTEWIYCSQAL